MTPSGWDKTRAPHEVLLAQIYGLVPTTFVTEVPNRSASRDFLGINAVFQPGVPISWPDIGRALQRTAVLRSAAIAPRKDASL